MQREKPPPPFALLLLVFCHGDYRALCLSRIGNRPSLSLETSRSPRICCFIFRFPSPSFLGCWRCLEEDLVLAQAFKTRCPPYVTDGLLVNDLNLSMLLRVECTKARMVLCFKCVCELKILISSELNVLDYS